MFAGAVRILIAKDTGTYDDHDGAEQEAENLEDKPGPSVHL